MSEEHTPVVTDEERLNNILKSLDSIDKKLEELDGVKSDNAEAKAKLEDLGESQLDLARQLATVMKNMQAKNFVAGQTMSKSVGELFVESKDYSDFKSTRRKINVELEKAAVSPVLTPAGSVPAHFAGIAPASGENLTVEGVLNSLPTTSNAITYVQEVAFENAAAIVAEGASKPESKFELTTKTATVETIAHFTRITVQLLEDAAALAAFINARMIYGLNRVVEKEILTGTGAPGHLSGLLKAGNFTAHGQTTSTMETGATTIDLINEAIGMVEDSGFVADTIFMNSRDWRKMQRTKDDNGNYIVANPGDSVTNRLWGVRVVPTPNMTASKFLVLDSRMACNIWNRSGISVGMFEQDGDNVTSNLITLRVERRMALSVEAPAAIVGGDLAIGA